MKSLYWFKLLIGPLAFIACLLYAPYSSAPLTFKTLGVAAWLILWWMVEAVPIAVTSLLPLILFPAIGNSTIQDTAANFGNPIIFLFMGGFILAIAMEKWNLHKHIALNILRITGSNANGILLGFIISTACISLWISNTATTVMMLPIGLSVIKLVESTLGEGACDKPGFKNFASSIMIGIAFAASIGGIGTIIGTPPNMYMVAQMKELHNFDMPFFQWMFVGVPIVIIMATVTYLIMTRWLLKNNLGKLGNTKQLIATEIEKLGKITYEQKVIAIIFALTVTLWISRTLINRLMGANILEDSTIALIGGLLLFIIPAKNKTNSTFFLSWSDMKKLPWKILLLFGGGLALAQALEKVGIIAAVGNWVAGIEGTDAFLLITLMAAAGVFMSEIMGNIALATIYIPVAMAIGVSLGQSPILFAIPIALATSFGFMLPIATPPNAIAYSSGYVNTKDMLKVGFVLDVFGIVLMYFMARWWLPIVFG